MYNTESHIHPYTLLNMETGDIYIEESDIPESQLDNVEPIDIGMVQIIKKLIPLRKYGVITKSSCQGGLDKLTSKYMLPYLYFNIPREGLEALVNSIVQLVIHSKTLGISIEPEDVVININIHMSNCKYDSIVYSINNIDPDILVLSSEAIDDIADIWTIEVIKIADFIYDYFINSL